MKKYTSTIILGIIAILLITGLCLFNFGIVSTFDKAVKADLKTVTTWVNNTLGISIVLDVLYAIYDFLKINKK